MTEPDVPVEWLLATDPALRWQVERDLLGAPEAVWRATRARIATEGMGARLLAQQDADGQWAQGAYFPGEGHWSAWLKHQPGQPWTATTWSLFTLCRWGLDAAALAGTAEKLAANSHWEYDDLPYWGGEVDVCINGFTLTSGTWLGADVAGLVDWFAEHRLADGGWNCEWETGSTRSSYHSTLNALEALLFREIYGPDRASLAPLRRGGEEYLLSRGLRRRSSTGEQVAPWATLLAYPPRYRYDVLRALDYFRRAAVDGVRPDPRLAEAVEIVRAKRQPDGRWLQEANLPGQEWFPIDVAVGKPSPWLTLYATRVLRWWDDEQEKA